MGLTLSAQQLEQLMTYLKLIQHWNRTINLTRKQSTQDIIIYHFLDCLAITPYLLQQSLFDLGSGAGLPGIVLAIYRPDWQLHLIESRQKKCHFLHHVCTTLQLNNVRIVNQRIQDITQPKSNSSALVVRAFATLENIIQQCYHWSNITLYAMKGGGLTQELSALNTQTRVQIIPLCIPFLPATRQLIKITL